MTGIKKSLTNILVSELRIFEIIHVTESTEFDNFHSSGCLNAVSGNKWAPNCSSLKSNVNGMGSAADRRHLRRTTRCIFCQ